MKKIYVLRDVGVGLVHGIYSSRKKAQHAAQQYIKRKGIMSVEYKPRKYLEFYWFNDDVSDVAGIVIEQELLQ